MTGFAGQPYEQQAGTGPTAQEKATRWALYFGQADFDAAGIQSAVLHGSEVEEFKRAVRLLESVAARNEMTLLPDVPARSGGHMSLSEWNIAGVCQTPDSRIGGSASAPSELVHDSQAKASTEFAGQPYAQRAATRQDVLYDQIERGLKKAKREYDRIARESGFLKPATRECWSEVESAFEALADLRTAAVTVAVAEPASTEFAGWGDTLHVGGAEVRLKHSRKSKGKKK